jgi:hypothetical protein
MLWHVPLASQIHCRRKVPNSEQPTETDVMDESVPEEVLLDENLRKEQGHHAFYMVWGCFYVCACTCMCLCVS